MVSLHRLIRNAALLLLVASAQAQEDLPLPQGEPAFTPAAAAPARFLKPTKSIKPPPVTGPTVAAVQPQVNAPTGARLRRLILVPGDLSPADLRQQILASGQTRTPVTVVGMNAPAPVLTNLASFFGSDVTVDTQKKLLETVRQGMGKTSQSPRRAEIVGWLPSEGVLAVAVYPES